MKPNSSMPSGDKPGNSVRMDQTRLNKFLDERDAAAAKNENKPRREYVRWPFRSAAIELTVSQPGGSVTKFNVACRNLSSGGIGVLHNSYMHKGTTCFVKLTNNLGEKQNIEGVVVRCVHVQGTVHDVGLKFLKPIDPKQYIALDPFSDGFSLETVNPENLRGTVLYIEDSPLDQALVRHFLRETQIRLIIAANPEEAIEKAMNGVDLLLCDYNLGDVAGDEIVQRLREAGLSQPILMVTADTSSITREKLIKAKANAFITKPLKQTTLFRALGEFMMLSNDVGGLASTLPMNHPNMGLLETFVQEIKDYGRQLEQAMAKDNATKVRALCLQIIGSAPVMGFQRLADLAVAAEKAVSSTMSVGEAAVPLRTLIGACQRATARSMAA